LGSVVDDFKHTVKIRLSAWSDGIHDATASCFKPSCRATANTPFSLPAAQATGILTVMKTIWKRMLCLALALLLTTAAAIAGDGTKIRVLVVTGGHDFEAPQFFKLFQENTNITFKAVEHPKAHEYFEPAHTNEYDVVVLYDHWQPISPEAKSNFAALIQNGKGLVVMHHSLVNYQQWPEYEQIIGGKYHLTPWKENGIEKPGSTYKHDVDFTVKVAPHPVTRGLSDFRIHDETYGFTSTTASITPILTTDEPTSGKIIGWTKTYGKARVFCFALGHDHLAYENPALQQILRQAIDWTSGRIN
jgi:type 1 glutamine amidotransferase